MKRCIEAYKLKDRDMVVLDKRDIKNAKEEDFEEVSLVFKEKDMKIKEIETSRKIADEKNKTLLQVLYRTLEATRNQVSCYGDCDECVLGNKDECLGSDIGKLINKISKFIEVEEL